jgi:hypothetical protein
LNKSWYSYYQGAHLSTGSAFAALKADGSITAWGASSAGGTDAPRGNSYTKVYSTSTAFAAIKTGVSVKVWGGSRHGDISAPSTGVYSSQYYLRHFLQ